MRNPNTTRSGSQFDEWTILLVWQKGLALPGYDPSTHRRDACGAVIQRSDYGKQSQYGWEIDHIKPVSKGGTDDLSNLQPLQWQNNRHKGDNYPHWDCAVTSKR